MASFSLSLNLLGLPGAKLFSGLDQKNPKRNWVCIPLDLTEAKYAQNADGSQRVTITCNAWPTSDAYFDSAVKNAINRGEEPPTREKFASHQVEISYTTDFIKNAIKAYGQALIEKVLKVSNHADELKAQDPNDENTTLFKSIRSQMQKRFGNMYVKHSRTATATAPAANVAQGVAGYQPSDDANPFAGQDDADELPF